MSNIDKLVEDIIINDKILARMYLNHLYDLKENYNQEIDESLLNRLINIFKKPVKFNDTDKLYDYIKTLDLSDYFNLNFINTSRITDMSHLFYKKPMFNKDISKWDVSNVTLFTGMFKNTRFNQPLNSWNVSKARQMNCMFQYDFKFNQPLNSWNVSNVINMAHMFQNAGSFNQPLNSWDVSNVTNMEEMFMEAGVFNQPLDNWNLENVKNTRSMFEECKNFTYNLNTPGWANEINNLNASRMFYKTKRYNQSMSKWRFNPNCNVTDFLKETNWNLTPADMPLQNGKRLPTP